MRVLHVHSGNLYGGVETLLATLARHRALCPAMEPHFALCFDGRLGHELEATGASVHDLGAVRVSRPASVWRARRTLRDLLQAGGFDAVICHAVWSQVVFGPAVRSVGVPLIFWLHDAAGGTHWLERWASLTPPDLAIYNSRFTGTTLRNVYPHTPAELLFYPVTPFAAKRSGIDSRGVRTELATPENVTVIIQVSRMEPYKGHRLHLDALGRLRDTPGWVCWQVGGAQRPHELQYKEELVRTAAELGIGDRIRFLGQRSDVPRLLGAADIHCQPNIAAEPFGITFVEALYAGLPVVTTALGGAKEIVTQECGILVDPGDADALAGALGKLIQEPAARAHLGAAGPSRARELSDPAVQLARLSALLTSVDTTRAT